MFREYLNEIKTKAKVVNIFNFDKHEPLFKKIFPEASYSLEINNNILSFEDLGYSDLKSFLFKNHIKTTVDGDDFININLKDKEEFWQDFLVQHGVEL